jgi:hypothetical protein
MHTIELIEQAVALAERLGYGVRQEWLGGCAGGFCEVAGRRWIFVDVALTPGEQLAQLVGVLSEDPALHLQSPHISLDLQRRLNIRKSA